MLSMCLMINIVIVYGVLWWAVEVFRCFFLLIGSISNLKSFRKDGREEWWMSFRPGHHLAFWRGCRRRFLFPRTTKLSLLSFIEEYSLSASGNIQLCPSQGDLGKGGSWWALGSLGPELMKRGEAFPLIWWQEV